MVRIIQPLLSEAEQEALNRVLEYLADEAKEYRALAPAERRNHIYESVLTLRTAALLHRPLFELGRTLSTPGALAALNTAKENGADFLRRHQFGDWGDVGHEDWEQNDQALTDGSRLFSVYRTRLDERIWVITEADRSATTLLLPDEY
jgi:hypothetical protein